MSAIAQDEDLSDQAIETGVAIGSPARRHTRRLEDKLLIAFHHACDVNDLEVATQVLRILELMLSRRPSQPDSSRRRNMESFVAAHERMWHIRNRGN